MALSAHSGMVDIPSVFSPGRGLAGFPQKKLRWRTKSQEDVPVRAQEQASSQTDF